MLIQGDIYRENSIFRINDDEKVETVNMGGYMDEIFQVNYKGINLIAQVIDVVPITIGPAYQLISSDIYCKLGKSKEAKKKRDIFGITGVVTNAVVVGSVTKFVVASKRAVGKTAGKAVRNVAVKQEMTLHFCPERSEGLLFSTHYVKTDRVTWSFSVRHVIVVVSSSSGITDL
jgi:hypothetical protein